MNPIDTVIDLTDAGRNPDQIGLTIRQFETFCIQIRQQPDWRLLADKCHDYYDNNQLDQDTLNSLTDKGMGPLTRNLIAPTVNLVLGIEAQNKRDWKVESDNDEYEEVARGLSARLHEAEREARADRAISDAFAGQVKAGIGWVEVARNSDPFKYPHKIGHVHRREMWWDWFAREPDLSDASWVIRRRWYPVRYLEAVMPQWQGVFRSAMDNWGRLWLDQVDIHPYLVEAYDQAARTSIAEMEWIDRTRQRICVYEVRHRVYHRGHVLRLPDDTVVEMDLNNPRLLLAIQQGAKPEPAVYSKWRVSLWAGPYRLSESGDIPNVLPFIPFWGFREDLTGIPYGIIRSMISQQDEINARRQMLMWLLSSVVVEMDADALDLQNNSIEDVMREVARPDATIVLNPLRRNANGFRVSRNAQLAIQQFELMKDAETGLQSTAGVFQDMLGKQGAATSGIAIGQLINQGTTGLAELFDNYSYARKVVGDRLLDQDRQMIKGRKVDVVVGESGKKRVIVTLNRPVVDPQSGAITLQNDTEASKVKIALEDVPSTPTYRQQQLSSLGEILKSLPPQLQALLVPYYIELTDMPEKHDMAEVLRKSLGIAELQEGEADPEKAELQAKLQAAMQMIEQLQTDPVRRKAEADADKSAAQAELARAQADKLHLETLDQGLKQPAPAEHPAVH